MNKRLTRVVKVIEDASSINICMKLLNLELNSYFLCLLNLIEESIIEYKDGEDYSYLIKAADYLQKTYEKLSVNTKQLHRKNIITLRSILKKQLNSLIKNDRKYFGIIYESLDNMLKDNKKEPNDIDIEEESLYDLLKEVIFQIKSLEYLDKLIEKNPNILNSKKDTKSIFEELIQEYIKQIIIEDKDSIDYYERVINKFLLTETFDLTDQMKDNIINTLLTFINNKKNLYSNTIKKIKFIIEQINNKGNLFKLFNIPKYNPKIIQEDLDLFKIPVSLSTRVRLYDHIITIDDDGAKVLDDGISYSKLENGNTLFKVHISDPLGVLDYESDTIKEAKSRGTTIYQSDETINMLPLIFGRDKLSLVKGQDRLTKTFCFELDKNFNIVNFYVLNTIINVSDKLTYDYINDIYSKGGTNKEEEHMLTYYDNLVSSLKQMFKNVRLYHEMKEELGNVHTEKTKGFSHNLVSYSMILTGYYMAKYFHEHNLPYVYRCHKIDEYWISLLDDYLNNPNNIELRNMIKSIKGNLPKSYYSGINEGHKGLDLDYYSHTTSPLRRFSDLLNVHAINTCYFKVPLDQDVYELETEINEVCKYLNMQTNTIDDYLGNKSKIK